MKFSDLQNAVKSAAAIRCRTRLQPAGGEGDKVEDDLGLRTRRTCAEGGGDA